MEIDAAHSHLQEISVERIDQNPENPRIFFRQEELDSLLDPIRQFGVQVPITVYKHRHRYTLIDGERRWRCSIKLNKPTIPALIQEKPDELTNLLLMFNIHALREQWDLLTIANKLPRIVDLLEERDGRPPTELALSQYTGLSRGVIRRCRLLMDLPDEYKQELLNELAKPKPEQKLSEDFFIEMERALKTVERAMPAVVADKNQVRWVLIDKYKAGVIENMVDFRDMAKIARAENVECDAEVAEQTLRRLFEKNKYSIKQAFKESVSEAYSERDVLTRINGLVTRLEQFKAGDLDEELHEALNALQDAVKRLLEGD